jgi:hypothetical protein
MTDSSVVIAYAAGAVGCDSIDFNNDGIFPDNADITSLLVVFAGGAC